MNGLLLSVPLFPLTAALLAWLVGLRAPRASGWIAVAGPAGALAALLLLIGRVPQVQMTWLHAGELSVTLGLRLDGLALLLALLTASVGLLISVYAVGYMAAEAQQLRFFATFACFIGAMLTLVLADSFLLLFAAWEFVGLASFLLIGFWYKQEDARRAAQSAFVLTRLGDLGLLLGWLWALLLTGTTAIDGLLSAVRAGAIPPATLTALALLFFAGAIGKSAQLPLAAWLPAAMAGPTPVSALIHSATMVAAGVYLLLRLFPLFAAAPLALTVVFWVGAATALVAALVASVQNDLKRVLAWSTVSQLGEMFFALGLGGPLAAAYHLTTHATFKASLFLASGAVDHAAGTRDLRRLGGLARAMPLTALAFVVAALALAGVPPFAGFWSEDAILAHAQSAGLRPALLLLLLVFLAGVYIGRAGMATFGRRPDATSAEGHDPGPLLLAPLLLLALAAAGLGWLLHGRLEQWLELPAPPEIGLRWQVAASAAGIAGLAFGVWRVWQRGPVPAFGPAPTWLERGLGAVTVGGGRLALRGSRVLRRIEALLDNGAAGSGWAAQMVAGLSKPIERGFDGVSAATGWAAQMVAGLSKPIERGFDGVSAATGRAAQALAGATKRIEGGFDATAHTLGDVTMILGRASETNEQQGIALLVDRFAGLFGRAGAQLRRSASGKLYLYTLGLFIWMLVVGFVGSFLLWL